MKQKQLALILTMLLCMIFRAAAQSPQYYCDIRNHSFVSSQVYEFDIFLTRSGATPLELANYQAAIQLNPLIVAGGTLTPSIVAGSSQLNASQQPTHIAFDASTQTLKIAPQAPPRTLNPGNTSTTNGTLIPGDEGYRVCRVQLNSNLPFGQAAMNPVWNFDVDPYNTVVSAFTGSETAKVNTIITMQNHHSRKLQLTAFLEGAYDPASDAMLTSLHDYIPLTQPYDELPWEYYGTESVVVVPDQTVDWVLVELRDATQPELALPGTTQLKRAYLLNADGTLSSQDGFSTPELNFEPQSNLYAVVRHRNHVAIMSANPLVLSGDTYSYDFSESIDQAFNGSAGYKQIDNNPPVFGLVAADIDADGSILTTDFNAWAIQFGNADLYTQPDADLDGQVFTTDFNKWAGNFGTDNPIESLPLRYQSQVPL